jgi:antibiotic biosynthesis monooxygenase (ABM) superfamily enzyme
VVIPPVPPVQSDWVMVQRFQTIEQLRAWLESDARRLLLDEVASLLVDEGTTNVIEGSNTELSSQDMVTEIITVGVKRDMEEAYRAWVDRVRQMQARFPGYQRRQLQPPIPGLQDDWVSLLRFDTLEHLNVWLESNSRRAAGVGAGDRGKPRLRLVAAPGARQSPVDDVRRGRIDPRPVRSIRRRVQLTQLSAERPLANSNAEALTG